MTRSPRFATAAIATPHALATGAGRDVLAGGGNAVDAVVAANLVLGVVTPYHCGFGGDLFAIVWRDGPVGYNGSGRAPAAATPEAVRRAARTGEMPQDGPLTVTVPGAVAGWFDLLERFGSLSFAEAAAPALRLAREGFVVSEAGAADVRAAAPSSPEAAWVSAYGGVAAGSALRLPELADTIGALRADGPEVFYEGAIGAAIAGHVRAGGGLLDEADLAAHRGEWVLPLSARFGGVDVLELPPNTQGVTALEALNLAAGLDLGEDGPRRSHLLIEAAKVALADREAFVTDAEHLPVPAERLASRARADERRAAIDPERASHPGPAAGGPGGTAYLCAVDGEGMWASLSQSNWTGFGSGLTVPGWGINLHNRGALFSLDPAHVNVIGPARRTMHTLIPAIATREGRPWAAFGTMGGHGQPQTHLQLLVAMLLDGLGPQEAVERPRWFVEPGTWTVALESRFPPDVRDGLARRGHRVVEVGPFDSLMGHAHAIVAGDGALLGGTDPRCEGAVLGD